MYTYHVYIHIDIYAMYIHILIKQPFMREGHQQEEANLFVYILIKQLYILCTMYIYYVYILCTYTYRYVLCIHTMYIHI